MILQKVVIPACLCVARRQAQAGIQAIRNQLKTIDSRFHGNDTNGVSMIFYENVIIHFPANS
jgi:hypothetical protein